MSTKVAQGKSKDDLSIPEGGLNLIPLNSDRRTRSNSPVKNRYSLPPNLTDYKLPSIPRMDDDIKSIMSSTSFNQERLKQAAKSPIAKRLHIIASNSNSPNNGGKYTIPIPFTLKLPPKLSSVNTTRETSAASSVVSSPHGSRAGSPTRSMESSRSNSPSKTKQSKLVFTRNGYEKVDLSLDSDSDIENSLLNMSLLYQDDLNKRIALSKRTVPPPSVSTNNSKFASKVFLSRNTDELSIIEEVSNCGSRHSSVLSKLNSAKKEADTEAQQQKTVVTPIPIKATAKPSHALISPFNNPQIKDTPSKQQDKSLPKLPTTDIIPPKQETATSDKKLTPGPDRTSVPNFKTHKYNKSLPAIPVHRSTTNGPNKSQVPKSQRETNLNMLTHASDPDKAPKIHKRSFSDESHVSSVSSFSSVGDFMHIARLQAMSPPAEKLRFINFNHGNNQNQLKIQPKSNDVKPNDSTEKLENPKKSETQDSRMLFIPPQNIRNVSSSSTSSFQSLGTSSSWDSLQKSIDITLGSRPDEEIVTKKSIKPTTKVTKILGGNNQSDDGSWLDTSESDSEDENNSNNQITQEYENTKSLNIHKEEVSNDKTVLNLMNVNNTEINRNFYFPNTFENSTNSQEVKDRVPQENNRKARHSFYSSNGQIEIPDLSDKRFSDEYSSIAPSSYNGTTFSEIRTEISVSDVDDESNTNLKIGVPGRDAIKHLKQQYSALGDDSDADYASNITSLYNTGANSDKMQMKPASVQPQLECNLLVPGRRSPAKHARHKSMFNIDFDLGKGKNNSNHSRHKSVDILSEMTTFGKQQSRANTDSRSAGGDLDESAGSKSRINIEQPVAPLVITRKPSSESKHVNNNIQKEEQNQEQEEILNIKVAEPPKKVDYAVDFKESNSQDEDFGTPFITPRIGSRSIETSSGRNIGAITKSLKPKTRLVASKGEDSDSETESVVIDLTKDKYDVVHVIGRKDSTRSYKSTTETINGKNVEVVLVEDEDEDEEENEEIYDELMSIYSKYRNDSWLFRNNSTTSSTASFSSRSSSTLRQKQRGIPSSIQTPKHPRDLNIKRSTTESLASSSSTSTSMARYKSKRILPPTKTPSLTSNSKITNDNIQKKQSQLRHKSMPALESHYFDYASNDQYDFNTFMQQRRTSQKEI